MLPFQREMWVNVWTNIQPVLVAHSKWMEDLLLIYKFGEKKLGSDASHRDIAPQHVTYVPNKDIFGATQKNDIVFIGWLT